MTTGILYLESLVHDKARLETLKKNFRTACLASFGCREITEKQFDSCDFIVIGVMTGGTENIFLKLWPSIKASGKPFVIASSETDNSLPAADQFIVRDIQIDGLVRLTPDNVYGMIPVSAGRPVNDTVISNTIRSLYASGLFDDIKVVRDGDNLLITVVERPVISSVELKGNKLIPKEALLDGLKKMGVAEGEVLKKSTLQTLESELEQQYMQQGRYEASVKVIQQDKPNNRVDLIVEFIEGKAAKVVDINLIGNTVFSDDDIKQVFAVKESGWSSIVSGNDRYAREKMAASMESLRALYLNKGYINFDIVNSNLNLSEDKKNVFIEVAVNEGEQFKFGQSKFLGDALYKPEELESLKIYNDGDIYSQEKVSAVKQQLIRKFGNARSFCCVFCL